ncbi:MAG: NlpC/P60 family protein [Bacteroidota bacterium]
MLSICHLSVVPVRREASDKSEQVTQLLFGELAEILEVNGNWAAIRTLEEEYPGFVDPRQLTPLTDEQALLVQTTWNRVVASETAKLTYPNGETRTLVAGSRLPGSNDHESGIFGPLKIDGLAVVTDRPSFQLIREHALQYLGTPYLWGGRSPFGIDCSGFTQLVYRLNGLSLPRDAWQQASSGLLVDSLDDQQTGDLAFFKNAEGRIVHVGILLDAGRIIHASGEVRIDLIDNQGILNSKSGAYSHSFDSLRRYFQAD